MQHIARFLIPLFVAAAGCVGSGDLAQQDDCRYVRRVGSRIPRLECGGVPATPGYGEMNQQQVQDQSARMARPGGGGG